MRVNYFTKNIFYFVSLSVTLLLYISMQDIWSKQNIFYSSDKIKRQNMHEVKKGRKIVNKNVNKYLLQWTPSQDVPFSYMGVGNQGFIDRKCAYTNCIVTDNRSYFGGDYTKFDVIAFSGPRVVNMNKSSLPKKRSPHQKYVFASIESSDYYPVCSHKLDNFFNWTWTYKLDSEVQWGYMVVRDAQYNVIGPKKEMHWLKLEEMEPVDEELKEKLKSKTKAAAWFVSNCYTMNVRELFVSNLQNELSKYQLDIDIYGECGSLKCPRKQEEECLKLVEKDYYFYLSFENSFAEDYVTEKLLNALKHNAIPIVYGTANYTRFMPHGIYLNARKLGVKKLAVKMYQLIQHFDEYTEYFRWKKHYSYHKQSESPATDEYCRFCSILNEEDLVKKTSIYHNFKEWWDPPNSC